MPLQLRARPARGNLIQGFGPRPKPTPTSPAIHYGEDRGWGNGRQVYAAADGVIKSYADAGAYGRRLVIDHGVIDGARWETWYCHLEQLEAGYGVGGRVIAGERVAVMGDTGNVTAMHLHFEVRRNGVAVDPAPLYRGGTMATIDDVYELVQKSVTTSKGSPSQAEWLRVALVDELGKLRKELRDAVYGPDDKDPNTTSQAEWIRRQLAPRLDALEAGLAKLLELHDVDEPTGAPATS
jgi:hypothetical protein